MNLYQLLVNVYPELTPADFDELRGGTIQLRDDTDGYGPYIAKWEYHKPIPEGFKLGKN